MIETLAFSLDGSYFTDVWSYLGDNWEELLRGLRRTLQVSAIAIAGAAGLRIGMAVAFPGRLDRLTAATRAGRVAGLAMIGVVLMLFVAGGLEGIGRQVVTATAGRFAIGGAALVGWLAYFFGAGRARHG